jgi:hypothetical protein
MLSIQANLVVFYTTAVHPTVSHGAYQAPVLASTVLRAGSAIPTIFQHIYCWRNKRNQRLRQKSS